MEPSQGFDPEQSSSAESGESRRQGSAKRPLIPGGPWWRFSDYELAEDVSHTIRGIRRPLRPYAPPKQLQAGTRLFVRPRPGARLQAWFPWDSYTDKRGAPKAHQTPAPYEDFLNLARTLLKQTPRDATTFFPHLVPGDPEALLKFCRSYGLLGLLPWSARRIVLPNVIYERTGIVWLRVENLHNEAPRVQRVSFTRARWTDAAIEDILREYFPAVTPDRRDTFEIPSPGSEAFWRAYAEPLDEILHAAVYLDDLRVALKSHRLAKEARILLDVLLADVNPNPIKSRGKQRLSFQASSLFGYFALMLAKDSTSGLALLECPICGKAFTSDNRRATYCSEQHRWIGQKRKQRQPARRRHR